MNAHRHEPLGLRGPVLGARRTQFWIVVVVLVVGLELAGTVAVPAMQGAGRSAAPAPSVPAAAAAAVAPAAPVAPAATHGNLVVPSGKTDYIPEKAPPAARSTYYQGGNITVQAGGTLIVQNTTLSFVNYVSDTGTLPVRLGHIYGLVDNGTVIFRNSTLTTDTFVLNPYAKLNVVVRGTMTFDESNVESAGFVNVVTGGDLTLNESSLRPNPGAASMDLPNTTLADVAFAPTLSVEAGGTANLFSSAYTHLYADNLSLNGTPGSVRLTTGNVGVSNTSVATTFLTGTTSEALIADWAYPSAIHGGRLTIDYADISATSTTVTPTVTYGGIGYTLTPVTLLAGVIGEASTPFTTELVNAINTAGLMTYLNRTGDFGQAAGISVSFHITSGPTVPSASLVLALEPEIDFGAQVSGAASHLNTVDTFVGLTFALNGTPPWRVHQLNFTDGATGELGNLTVQGHLDNYVPLDAQSVINTDASSNAYLFRWAKIDLHGRGGVIPMPGATITAPYAYSGDPAEDLLAESLNNFKTNDRAVYDYLESWAGDQGAAAYGESSGSGVAALLLASNDINGTNTPDGQFLGDYDVQITPADGAGAVRSFNWSVSPFPRGVANLSAGYGEADDFGSLTFPLFYSAATIPATNGITITANNVTTTAAVTIGEQLGVQVTVTDDGPAVIHSLSGRLLYNATSGLLLSKPAVEIVDLTAPGQTAVFSFSWKVNDTTVGFRHGKTITDTLAFSIDWNNDSVAQSGGVINDTYAVQFAPSPVAIALASGPADHTLSASKKYAFQANIIYNGSQPATVELLATPSKGGAAIVLEASGTLVITPGPLFQNSTIEFLSVAVTSFQPGTSYVISWQASYFGITATKALPGTYEVPSSPAKFSLTTKVLGLPLWLWLVIAALIVVAVLAFLFVTRRQAAGKVVECGECGNLIPETAKVCPKCGAEFESDVVRCSRCSSTIPANSQYCPECAAQLLGKPGEGGADPERQAYADFTERFRAEAKKDLGENYSEGAFWDWWKRQPSYTPFSQWKLQQGQGTSRLGATAPPPQSRPPGGSGGAGGAAAAGGRGTPPAARRGAAPPPSRPPSSGAAAPAAAPAPVVTETTAAPAPPPAGSSPEGLKPCPNCGKEIPREYLVCPFCGSVTQ